MTANPRRRARATGLTDRRAECRALDEFAEAVRAGESRTLVVRGDPGVGNTTPRSPPTTAVPAGTSASSACRTCPSCCWPGGNSRSGRTTPDARCGTPARWPRRTPTKWCRSAEQPGGTRAILEMYRARQTDAEQNRPHYADPISCPVLAVGAQAYLGDELSKQLASGPRRPRRRHPRVRSQHRVGEPGRPDPGLPRLLRRRLSRGFSHVTQRHTDHPFGATLGSQLSDQAAVHNGGYFALL